MSQKRSREEYLQNPERDIHVVLLPVSRMGRPGIDIGRKIS